MPSWATPLAMPFRANEAATRLIKFSIGGSSYFYKHRNHAPQQTDKSPQQIHPPARDLSVRKRKESHLNFRDRSGFWSSISRDERSKKMSLGMLNVLPQLVHVKRKSQHLVALMCQCTELGTYPIGVTRTVRLSSGNSTGSNTCAEYGDRMLEP